MFRNRLFVFVAAVAIAAPATTIATEVTFTLDPLQSDVQMLADIFGGRWFPQLPGSDTAANSGSITVDVDDVLAPTQIQVLSANTVAPDFPTPLLPEINPQSVFDPGDPAPATYGLRGTDTGEPDGTDIGYVALRDVGLSVSTVEEVDDILIPVIEPVDIDGNFSSLSLQFEAVTATADAWIGFLDVLSDDLSGETFENDDPDDPPPPSLDQPPFPETVDSSYVVSGNMATLTIVMNSHEDAGDFRDMYEGLLVGTAEVGVEIPGDFDGDGDVDGDDFLVWQLGFGTIYDGNDFLTWQSNFPFPGGGSGAGAVPEPASLAMLALMAIAVAAMRKRLG